MKALTSVLTEISAITSRIREEYPELYQLLEENKVSVYTGGKEIDGNEFAEYLDSLKEKLEHYVENHTTKA
jgi:hypothetical protein